MASSSKKAKKAPKAEVARREDSMDRALEAARTLMEGSQEDADPATAQLELKQKELKKLILQTNFTISSMRTDGELNKAMTLDIMKLQMEVEQAPPNPARDKRLKMLDDRMLAAERAELDHKAQMDKLAKQLQLDQEELDKVTLQLQEARASAQKLQDEKAAAVRARQQRKEVALPAPAKKSVSVASAAPTCSKATPSQTSGPTRSTTGGSAASADSLGSASQGSPAQTPRAASPAATPTYVPKPRAMTQTAVVAEPAASASSVTATAGKGVAVPADVQGTHSLPHMCSYIYTRMCVETYTHTHADTQADRQLHTRACRDKRRAGCPARGQHLPCDSHGRTGRVQGGC